MTDYTKDEGDSKTVYWFRDFGLAEWLRQHDRLDNKTIVKF